MCLKIVSPSIIYMTALREGIGLVSACSLHTVPIPDCVGKEPDEHLLRWRGRECLTPPWLVGTGGGGCLVRKRDNEDGTLEIWRHRIEVGVTLFEEQQAGL